MKKLIIYLLTIFPLFGISQNFVPNPSFEQLDSCPPPTVGSINYAVPWYSPTLSTPNTFNACAVNSWEFGIPSNIFGYQNPRTGNGYAGIVTYYSISHGRDYISVKLDNPLIAGKKYCIGFYASLSNYDTTIWPNGGSRYAIDCLGAYLSDSAIHLNTSYIIPVIPQIVNPSGNYLVDTLNWMLISGTYISKLGGEQYLTIGNFNLDDSTNIIQVSMSHSGGADYYIDDVYVMDCNDTLGIENYPNPNTINIYPNPTSDNVTLQFSNIPNENCTFELFDALGNKIFSKDITESENLVNISLANVAKGVYICRIFDANHINLYDNKLVILK